MTFSKYAMELRVLISTQESNADYFTELISEFIDDTAIELCKILNQKKDTLGRYINGSKDISPKHAKYIFSNRNTKKFHKWISGQFSKIESRKKVVKWLTDNGQQSNHPADTCTKLLEDIIFEISNRERTPRVSKNKDDGASSNSNETNSSATVIAENAASATIYSDNFSLPNCIAIFGRKMQYHRIKEFVSEVDPTNIMCTDWVERCDKFIFDINHEILFPYNSTDSDKLYSVLNKINEFVETLNDYTTYLGLNMRPLEDNLDYFVPLFRDENVKWALSFNEKVTDYRQRLCSVYRDIYTVEQNHEFSE